MELSSKSGIILVTLAGYFLILILISYLTSRNSNKDTFFTGNRQSPWYLVAFGMIGASLSGVTFISIPGWVAGQHFTYMFMVFGYVLGYAIIAEVLLPMYYRLNVTSIYEYLAQRFGDTSYKVGASYFILSRVIGAAFRLFLVAGVLHQFVFANPDIFPNQSIPFWISVLVTILLIWVYTFKGGIKTIVYTDALQTLFMLLSLGISIYVITTSLDWNFSETINQLSTSKYTNLLDNAKADNHWWLGIINGMFIAIVMTGLDQDMMQKNLTINSIKKAKKNIYVFSGILVIVNFFFLILGALLYIYCEQKGIQAPALTDELFPTLSFQYLGVFPMVIFLLGITAAAYSSADSALTALTTSFIIDIWGKKSNEVKTTERYLVHIGFSFLLFIVVVVFKSYIDEAVIKQLFTAAGYTYGPLLGLFTFGLFTSIKVKDKWVWVVCVLSPIFCYGLNYYLIEKEIYKFGFEILLLNGAITFLGLFLLSQKHKVYETD